MTLIKPYFLLLLLPALLWVACEPDLAPLEIPEAYDGSEFAAHAETELAVMDQLGTLASTLKEGRDPANTVSVADLSADFTAGSPSVSDITTAYYRNLVEDWLPQVEAASGQNFDLDQVPNGDGGVLGGHLLEANGLELEQMIEKGLFGAALYHHAITLMSGELTEATADQLLAIYGAHPDFANSDNSDLHSNPDRALAKYAARRDPADGTGLYTTLRGAFIKLQAALQAGPEYEAEAQEALATIQENWEKANAATAINYLLATINKLNVSDPSDDQIGSALHSYSEAVGFLHGWRMLPDEYRLITDGQIDDLLVLMNAPVDAAPSSYLLATDSFNELPDLQVAIDELQGIYDFTPAEVASFEFNQVNQQGR